MYMKRISKHIYRYIQLKLIPMKNFINNMLGGGDTSIKRVIAFLGFLFIAAAMMFNLKAQTDLVDAVKLIVLVCIGGNVAEKFMPTNKSK